MSSVVTWGGEGFSSSSGAQTSNHLRETTLDNRLEALKEVARTFLSEVESLRGAEPHRTENQVRLYDEVRRFETDLIRAALARTRGNQARAARLLGVKHTTLNAKIKRYKIPITDEPETANNGDREIAA